MPATNQIECTAMQTLIRLVTAGACKENVSDLAVDWEMVMPLIAEQNVSSLVACALSCSPGMECPPDLRACLLNAMQSESTINMIRQQRIMHLLQEMKLAGIEAIVIKGYAVAGCYAYPECRGSVDTDLLVDVQQEKAAIELLENKGFKVTIRGSTSHHSICQHKKYGVVELHVKLYAELIRDIWFGDVDEAMLTQESFLSVNDENGMFVTLGYTDHLIFLTLHMVKHFILEGLTLRMMLDLALFFAKHREAIDVNRYWSVMETLKYSGLVNCVLWSMVTYGGFKASDFSGLMVNDPKKLALVLSDLVCGGYMGTKEKETRYESGMEYNRIVQLTKKTDKQYVAYMVLKKLRTSTKFMFLTQKQLKEVYPCAAKYALFRPFLWMYNIFAYPLKKLKQGNMLRDIHLSHELSPTAQRRVKLFQELGMFDDERNT